jgi:hypothetical protein
MSDMSETAEPDWVPAPTGQLAQTLRLTRRNRNAKRLATGAFVLLVTLFVTQRAVSTLTSRPLSCDATRSYAEAFLNDSIDANTKKTRRGASGRLSALSQVLRQPRRPQSHRIGRVKGDGVTR